MEARELRIGNYVYYLHDGKEVSKVEKGEELDTCMHIFDPIPLTEEWLMKFGFKETKIAIGFFLKETFQHTQLMSNGKITRIRMGIGESQSVPIKYVHQLQNLYFALTGEDLQTK